MNKEFIPYEESLELKELGFDEPCFGYYTEDKIWRPASYSFEGTEYPFNSIWPYPTSPTYSQAFRWFREKHKLYHTINMFGDWDKPQYSYLVSGRTMNNPAHMWHFEDKDSHEEAELACLKKLIEIVKNK
jgi:hypothetical protein